MRRPRHTHEMVTWHPLAMNTKPGRGGRKIGGTTILPWTTAVPTERVTPGPGQESVWDYPRPPRVEPVLELIRVVVGGETIADTTAAVRVLETAGAPVYYLPRSDVRTDLLTITPDHSLCEWKGRATYLDLAVGGREVSHAAWAYPTPNAGYEELADRIAFYASAVDEAWVADERATPQPGSYYGGWVTSRIVGPFKGEPGTEGW